MIAGPGDWPRQERARAFLASMTAHRQHLHANPEVGMDLPATHEYLASHLRSLGLEPEVHTRGGITARIVGRVGRGTVRILRTEMDALPVQERTGLDFASTTPGAMHACGHDLHMAMLLGAAELFVGEPPTHDVVLVFQPGEEADRGALAVMEHESLRGLPSDAIAFAIHVNALLPSGLVTSRPGVFMAFGDWFRVTFTGPGGHASAPHLTTNPIDGFTLWTRGLHELVAELRAREPLVATVTEALAGNTVNVIPTLGSLRGTLRTLSEGQRGLLHERLAQLTSEVGAFVGLRADLEIIEGYPAVMNDPAVVRAIFGGHDAERPAAPAREAPEPSMVIEDFAYFLGRWPGAMVYLGAQVEGATSFNHSDDVRFDESVMTVGLALHSLVADLSA
jgi:amidohydrolase